ncbi:MAG TPA: hypothetical protein VMR52_05840 [Dehalococcoidia bacterium]|nr:hypothetical protein [Dehalococcoidia bacterium]
MTAKNKEDGPYEKEQGTPYKPADKKEGSSTDRDLREALRKELGLPQAGSELRPAEEPPADKPSPDDGE